MSTELLALSEVLRPGRLEQECARVGADPEMLRRFRNALLKRGKDWGAALGALPEPLRARFRAPGAADPLRLRSEQSSTKDGATKYLFERRGGQLIESVLMEIRSGRSTLCVSSQVGCAVRCGFCATGQSPVVQSLSSTEILAQVVYAQQVLAGRGRRLRNVVFMGMGEPLLNPHALYESLEALCSPKHFDLSPRHILVSTVGIPHRMVELARAWPKVGLALSLHSATQGLRRDLIPIAQRYPLGQLKSALAQCNEVQERPVMLEYLLLEGLSDQEQEIDALLDFCRGLRVRINLIPYNPVANLPYRKSPAARQEAISQRLRAAGLETTLRRSLGGDIAAACGQLVSLKKGTGSVKGKPSSQVTAS